MEETNQNSQTSLDFNVEKFEPKDESEIQQIIKYCFKKNLPIEIVGSQTKQGIGKKLQCAKTLKMSKYSGIIDIIIMRLITIIVIIIISNIIVTIIVIIVSIVLIVVIIIIFYYQ